jgi:citrate lyase subunit beta / citryl-CoA lyase
MSDRLRSILFAPANLPDIIRKMPRSEPDVAVACLEDGTPPDHKVQARELAAGAVRDVRAAGWRGRMFVRVNDVSTEWFAGDVACAVSTPFDGIVLPMVDSRDDVERLMTLLAELGAPDMPIVLGIETVRGVINVDSIMSAAPTAIAIYFGGEDYATSLGAVRSSSNAELGYPRARVALHARAHGLSSFDHGTVRFDDDDRFRRESIDARGLGFTGKICFHPRQAALAHELFQPSDEEVAWSRRVIEAYDEAEAAGRGAPEVDGQMIDGPLVKRAREILATAAAQ